MHFLPKARNWLRPQFEVLEARRMLTVDVIMEWNAVLLEANANDHALASPEQGGPVLTARAFAIVSGAMYDAYNSIAHIGPSYLTMVPGATNAAMHAAVAQAAHDTLVGLFPSQQSLFQSALEVTLDRVANGPSEDWGTAVGSHVATRLLDARAADGTDFIGMSYDPNEEMGFHNVDPLNPLQGYYAPGAMDIQPFAISEVSHFAARPLDDASIDGRWDFLQSPEYTAAYLEVLQLGGDGIHSPTLRTAEQTMIGQFWAYDGRPGLGTPPRLYNQIVREIAVGQGNSEAENARLFALVNLAMADAGVASWNTKYDEAIWRPVLAVRYGAFDGNPATIGQEDWTPLGAPASNPRPGEINFTPPFPAYTSGHATFGAAAFQMLANFYQRDDIQFTVGSDELNGTTLDATGEPRPFMQRTFDSFTQAKLENAESRIYLGIHWRFDAEEGVRQGDAVADYVFDAVMDGSYTFSPAHYPHHNQALPTDVDNVESTTLADALHIVSVIRNNNREAVPLAPLLPGAPAGLYFDVNADNRATLGDALEVVSYLRYQRGLTEGEAQDPFIGTFHRVELAHELPVEGESAESAEPSEEPPLEELALASLLQEIAASRQEAAAALLLSAAMQEEQDGLEFDPFDTNPADSWELACAKAP